MNEGSQQSFIPELGGSRGSGSTFSSPLGRTNPSIQHNAWLLSFGDLLTLILCFFLLILASTPAGNKANEVVSNATHEMVKQEYAKNAAGTSFADSLKRHEAFELRLKPQDLKAGFESSVRNVLQLVHQASSRGYALSLVEIESCAADELGAGEAAWFLSLSRSNEIERQLIDAGIERSRLSLRVLGPHCRALDKESVERVEVILRVTFALTHG